MSSFRETTRAWRGMGILPLFFVLACFFTFSGCGLLGGKKNQPTTRPAPLPPQVEWDQQPIQAPPVVNSPIVQGPAPLAYLVGTDSFVRVMDLTDNIELLAMPVMARQMVSVIPDLGVQVGGATMKPMRLNPQHRYGIYISSNQENISRTGRVRPGSPYSPEQVPGRLP